MLRSKVKQNFESKSTNMVICKKINNNNAAKPSIVRLLFGAFVRSVRNTNGKTHGKIKFWLDGHIRRLIHKPEKHLESEKEHSLFELFQNCLLSQIINGKILSKIPHVH